MTIISIIAITALCTIALIAVIAWATFVCGGRRVDAMMAYDNAFDGILILRDELRTSGNIKLKMSAVKLDSVIDILADIEKVILEEKDSGHEDKVQ